MKKLLIKINNYTASQKTKPSWRLYETIESKWAIVDDNNGEWFAINLETKSKVKATNFLTANNVNFS